MSKYKIKAKCTSYYYGYPQARSTIVLKGIYFTAKVEWYVSKYADYSNLKESYLEFMEVHLPAKI